MVWAQGTRTTEVMRLPFAPDLLGVPPPPPRPSHSAEKTRKLSCGIRAETQKKMNSPNAVIPMASWSH